MSICLWVNKVTKVRLDVTDMHPYKPWGIKHIYTNLLFAFLSETTRWRAGSAFWYSIDFVFWLLKCLILSVYPWWWNSIFALCKETGIQRTFIYMDQTEQRAPTNVSCKNIYWPWFGWNHHLTERLKATRSTVGQWRHFNSHRCIHICCLHISAM